MTRIAFITGGARGIGAEICRRLSVDGFKIVVADLPSRKTEGDETLSSLNGTGHIFCGLDVSDESSLEDAFRDVEEQLGDLSVLVCNAAIHANRADGSLRSIVETSAEVWDLTNAVNLRGVFLCCKRFLAKKAEGNDSGRIINIASVSGQLASARANGAYAATKAGVIGFTRVLAREAAALGVTANCVAPGIIDAPMLHEIVTGKLPAADGIIPIGRLGQPSDVAAAVAFLASGEASYLTGTVIDVNGGYRMQ